MSKYEALRNLKEDFEQEFGKLSSRKLWILVRFAKWVRLRCRSNAAFNNFANSFFPYAKFKQVTKVKPSGESYLGLTIFVEGEEKELETPEDIGED